MINAYKKSKTAVWIVLAVTAAVIVFLWIHDVNRGYQIYIPIVATVLTLGIGYFLSKLLGNLIAQSETTKRLGFLHMDLDPEKFIDTFKDVPEKLKAGTKDHAVASSYLSDGYLASGNTKKALEVLDQGFEGVSFSGQPALEGLYHGNRLGILTDMGSYEEAEAEASEMERIIRGCDKSKTALAQSLTSTLLLRRARLSIADGKVIDSNWLNGLLPNAHYKLRELEICRTMAENALLKGNAKEARDYLDKIESNGGKTFYTAWAAEKKEEG